MSDPEPPPARTLAQKVDRLFQTLHPRDRGEFTFEEVAEAIRARGGPTISATYLWQLRRGLRDNPTKKHLEALAGFFGVPPAYFFDEADARRIDAELDLIAAMRDAGVRNLALRASLLTPDRLKVALTIIEQLGQLPAAESGPAGKDRPEE